MDADVSRSLSQLGQTMEDHQKALQDFRDVMHKILEPPKPPAAANKKAPDPIDENGDLIEVKRKSKTIINTKVTFFKIGEIDTLHDRFNAEVIIVSKWRDENLDGLTDLKPEDINWNCYWKPKLFVENAIGDQQGTIVMSVAFDKKGRATVVEKRRLKGAFQEFMELNQFPFDTQDITCSVTSEKTDKEVEIVEDLTDCCILNSDGFAGEQEWLLWKYVKTWRRTRVDENKHPKTNHSTFSSACRVSRRPEFFIWNILIVMFLICSLAFATFAVDFNLPQNRLQLAFILVLTTVSFKFVVNQSLPMIAYLTYMDKYILSTMGILVCICVWHAIVALFNPAACCPEVAEWGDRVALFIFGSFYAGFHLVFICIIVYVVQTIKKDSQENERIQIEKISKCKK